MAPKDRVTLTMQERKDLEALTHITGKPKQNYSFMPGHCCCAMPEM